MKVNSELRLFLEKNKNDINAAFPNYTAVTEELFAKIYTILGEDYDGMSDNCVYRSLLNCLKEIINYIFEQNLSKKYMRSIFKILDDNKVINCFSNNAKSRAKDIKTLLNRLVNHFTISWQGWDNDRNKSLKYAIDIIDYWFNI